MSADVTDLMNYFKLADPNDARHGALSDRIHLLKCEKEGEDPMCAITQSIFDEGEIAGYVKCLRVMNHLEDERIVEEIKKQFQLNDYQARTFVYPRKEETA